MIKMFVMKTCPYCEYVEKQVAGDNRFQVIDISTHVHKLAEFLKLRDNNPAFEKRPAERVTLAYHATSRRTER